MAARIQHDELRLTGLSCADCAAAFERRLATMPGVVAAHLNFSAGKLSIDHRLPHAAIVKAVRAGGYDVEQEPTARVLVFRLTGLDCADCAGKLAQRLQQTPGVESAALNFGAAKLTVTGRLDEGQIIAIVGEAGFGAHPEGHAVHAGTFLQTNQRVLTAAGAGALLLFGWLATRFALPHAAIIALYLGAVLVGGLAVFRRGLLALRAGSFDMNALMTIAVAGAIGIGEWPEAATVAFLFAVSNLLESYTMEKTRHSLRGLVDSAPREALVRRDGVETRLPVADVRPGETVIVTPGEKIPVDGHILHGHSAVNQAPITGESLPVEKDAGDEVFAGTINGLGALEICVTHAAEDTALARIIHLVEDAQAQRAPAQTFIDRFAAIYTPAVLVLAALVAVIPPLFFGWPWGEWIYRALALLVVACPCALVISTPVAIVSAIGTAARHGVLIKGGLHLEQAARLSAIAFDKTGTLTHGRPEVTEVIALNGLSEGELLRMAAAVESRSEHPLAQAILRHARHHGGDVPPVTHAAALAGLGAVGEIAGRRYYVGSPRLFAEQGIEIDGLAPRLMALQEAGRTLALVGTQTEVLGIIAVADELRDAAAPTVRALHEVGIRHVVMLTGDNTGTARAIADALGIDDVRAHLLPHDKVTAMQALLAEHGQVAMVGDGVNDAPALARATVGIAMGAAGSGTALETADIALMADDLTRLPYLVRLSRRAMGIIKQNIIVALALKALALALIFPGWLTLWMAVLADTGASILVTLNALRLVRAAAPAPPAAHCPASVAEHCEC